MNTTTIQPSDRIGSLRPYAAPSRDPRIKLMLDNNEGGPADQTVLEVIRGINPEDLGRYPDASDLERTIAERFAVDASRVVVTNGGDDVIDRVCRALLSPGDTLLTHTPGFVMIPRYAQLAGAEVVEVDWLGGDFNVQQLVDQIDPRTRLIALVSPCNPTGGIIDAQSIIEIASKALNVGAVVLLDQAYIEFAEDDPIDRVLSLPNVIVVRTFSKAMGLAGLRVGYAIGPREVVNWLRTVGGPYPVSTLSLEIARASIKRVDDRDKVITQTIRHRAQLTKVLEKLGIEVLPSQANFVLAWFTDAGAMHDALLSHGVRVRRFSQGSEINSYLRITVPADQDQLNQLIEILNTIGART